MREELNGTMPDLECVNCLANYHALKQKQERVDVLYEALLDYLSNPAYKEKALAALHFIEEEGE